MFDRGNNGLLWLGYGFRSNAAVVRHIEESIGVPIQLLRLCDPRFYHLDTCFCPLEQGFLLYYPAAFDAESNAAIETRVSPDHRFAVSEEDAIHFACNAVNIGHKVILNHASPELEQWLIARGFSVIQTRVSEFMKAGGSTKCLSLRLDEGGV